jgi:hypothetical protein
MLYPLSMSCVAKGCRKVWHMARLTSPAFLTAPLQMVKLPGTQSQAKGGPAGVLMPPFGLA